MATSNFKSERREISMVERMVKVIEQLQATIINSRPVQYIIRRAALLKEKLSSFYIKDTVAIFPSRRVCA